MIEIEISEIVMTKMIRIKIILMVGEVIFVSVILVFVRLLGVREGLKWMGLLEL